MRKVLALLIAGTLLSGLAAAYAGTAKRGTLVAATPGSPVKALAED
ncbi:hypothetical protein OKW76_04870 [Sphingomonas sp. S1-29]|uniref:Uncharacterized protein n=1 Tax=Sphingomonas qomolangmaensis TaxID=2918765 RepID=A0ABY5LA81_9SPHN|nr:MULTISPECIES: hypothetical protein [Sphingomonas]UUL83870.1 hypothetical protein NMP03_06660 [Sphingomonas qomolangmaensis]UZK70382.1 hypothetical protein OKW76_04870 [Sphingomonas sp. S1-29]